MSGVLGQRLGLKNSRTGVCSNSLKYDSNSDLVLRQVKYVYDCVKPSFARRYMTFGLVNASDKNSTSGCDRLMRLISHSQNAKAFVWGLSTRKIRTPCCTQNSTMLANSSQRLSHASHSKSNG